MPKRKCSSVYRSFGENLTKYRKLCGFTQQQVADILSLNRTTYTKYETGVSEPSFEILKKIVSIFGIDANALLGDETFEKNVADFEMCMYNLSREEQELLGTFRMFSREEKDAVLEKVKEIREEKNNNFE